MKITIDLNLCEGNERCVAAAPEVFTVQDDQARLLIEKPSPAQLEKVKLAIRMCPRQAISVKE